ncbi:hypothetical protein IE53DRAFT_217382 [Violaceomyces palustris]|uniref:Uncharacterized protein n=1 Tax=Violaceomyces palustris TaxID=1673888 RepID=A0ACD0NQE8_9BASI|nr:hypothetical protein IE53DRAFT_217382 [Violaceomyces palustris]
MSEGAPLSRSLPSPLLYTLWKGVMAWSVVKLSCLSSFLSPPCPALSLRRTTWLPLQGPVPICASRVTRPVQSDIQSECPKPLSLSRTMQLCPSPPPPKTSLPNQSLLFRPI